MLPLQTFSLSSDSAVSFSWSSAFSTKYCHCQELSIHHPPPTLLQGAGVSFLYSSFRKRGVTIAAFVEELSEIVPEVSFCLPNTINTWFIPDILENSLHFHAIYYSSLILFLSDIFSLYIWKHVSFFCQLEF